MKASAPPEGRRSHRGASLYLGASRWFVRGVRAARGAFDGFWLGVLSDADLDAVDARYYDSRESYRESAYNEQGLFEWEEAALDAHFDRCRRLIVTAAGGGREVLALRERGFDAIGYECHPELAREGRARLAAHGHEEALRRCARDEWPTADACDGVVVGWGSYMLIRGRRRRLEFLRGAARSLPPGGPLLVSFYGRDRLGFEHRVTAAVGNALRAIARRERLDAGDALAPNFVHFFTEAEIRDELREGGFELVDFGRTPYRHAVARRL